MAWILDTVATNLIGFLGGLAGLYLLYGVAMLFVLRRRDRRDAAALVVQEKQLEALRAVTANQVSIHAALVDVKLAVEASAVKPVVASPVVKVKRGSGGKK